MNFVSITPWLSEIIRLIDYWIPMIMCVSSRSWRSEAETVPLMGRRAETLGSDYKPPYKPWIKNRSSFCIHALFFLKWLVRVVNTPRLHWELEPAAAAEGSLNVRNFNRPPREGGFKITPCFHRFKVHSFLHPPPLFLLAQIGFHTFTWSSLNIRRDGRIRLLIQI